MPKKLNLLSILFLLASLLTNVNSPPANAEELVVDGKKYWTLDEVMEEGNRFLGLQSICNGNRECKNYFLNAYMLAGGKYNSSAFFSKNFFMVTALNPNNSTIRVLFHDKDTDATNWSGAEKDILYDLYLFWWENGEPQMIADDYTGVNSNENRHEIFTHTTTSIEEWLLPNTEVEIPIPNNVVSILKNNPLYYNVETKTTNAMSPGLHFESCLTEITGKGNYECRIILDEFDNFVYYPTEIKTHKNPEIPELHDTSRIPTTDKISTSTIRVPETTPELTSESIPSDSQDSIAEVTSNTIDTSQETIEIPLAADKEEHKFPWWIVVFIFSGIFLIIWWFIPTKSSKKS